MITKVFKWRCGSNLNLSKIGCLMNDGKIVAYTFLDDDDDISEMDSGGEFYLPDDDDHFFDSRDEAVEFHQHLKETYISKLKEVAPIIDKFEYNKDEIDLGQYIDALKPKENYYKDYRRVLNVNYLLIMALHTGFICINAQNIKVSEVVNVEWHKDSKKEDYAVLKTKGGNEVKTCDEVEFDAVRGIFGDNASQKYYKS